MLTTIGSLTVESDLSSQAILNILDGLYTSGVEVEYGQEYSGNAVLLLDDNEFYPIEKRIEHAHKFGGRIYKRHILVISDWEEVT